MASSAGFLKRRAVPLTSGVAAAVLIAAGAYCWNDQNHNIFAPAASAAPAAASTPNTAPAPTVGYALVTEAPTGTRAEYPGRVSPYLVAEVRPQIGGIVKSRLFDEGSDVKAGQVLYEIDPATYQAAYASAEAGLQRARATLSSLNSKASRYKSLASINAVSKQDYDDAVAAAQVAKADIAAAEATLQSAKINLDYTKIVAPIDGRIGRSSVTQGALVTANQDTALATIQTLDKVYVDLTLPAEDSFKIKQALTRTDGQKELISLALQGGTPYSELGTLEFSDVTVDQSTGNVIVRAVFPNPKHDLLPGMYVRASVALDADAHGFPIPQTAGTPQPDNTLQVMVIGADNKLAPRSVSVDWSHIGNEWFVTKGLTAGDRVAVDGLQKVRPGMAVNPVENASTTNRTK